jgi:hypothetical protein
MGNGSSFIGAKVRPGRDADHSPYLVPRSRMSWAIYPLPPSASMMCSGTALPLLCSEMLCSSLLQGYQRFRGAVFIRAMMEAISTSETSVSFCQTTRRAYKKTVVFINIAGTVQNPRLID